MKTMTEKERRRRRIDHVLRIFQDQEWGNLELLDAWDGDDLTELRDLLSRDEFETLQDWLRGLDEER